MERVEFISSESGDDLIVSFAIRQAEPAEIRTLMLMRTPKYESILDPSERGVRVSDEDSEEDEDISLDAVEFRGPEVRIVCGDLEFRLDCSSVDPEELEEAKNILNAMNFDNRFSLRFD